MADEVVDLEWEQVHECQDDECDGDQEQEYEGDNHTRPEAWVGQEVCYTPDGIEPVRSASHC